MTGRAELPGLRQAVYIFSPQFSPLNFHLCAMVPTVPTWTWLGWDVSKIFLVQILSREAILLKDADSE